jgi:SAM-dependent methyltransferase
VIKEKLLVSSEFFYDRIAVAYDELLTHQDLGVRELVESQFLERVSNGCVLDFGGGTGLDLEWLSRSQKLVYFLEPSVRMRSVAKDRCQGYKGYIKILDEELDFKQWKMNSHPFEPKVNGILANFAVFNCISELKLLFQSFYHITAKDSFVLATVLKPASRFHQLKYLFRAKKRSELTYSSYEGLQHVAYRYRLEDFSAAIKDLFILTAFQPVPGSDLSLLILKRK